MTRSTKQKRRAIQMNGSHALSNPKRPLQQQGVACSLTLSWRLGEATHEVDRQGQVIAAPVVPIFAAPMQVLIRASLEPRTCKTSLLKTGSPAQRIHYAVTHEFASRLD
jgi:hypothetical protein